MKFLNHLGIILFSMVVLASCQKEAATFVEKDLSEAPVVNAGNHQAVTLPVTNVTLTGTATSVNGPIVGYLWSMISGPNVPVIHSPSSPTTLLSGLVTGTYLMQLMAIDTTGLTGVDTVSITAAGPLQQTLTLQPTNNPTETHLFGGVGIDESGPSPDFSASAWTSGVPITVRSIAQFDLSSIPATATIISAKLTLYSNPTPLGGNLVDANFGTANAMYISKVAGPWSAATTNWTNQPAFSTADQVSIPHTNQTLLDLVDVDVKNLVSSMVAGPNYGFMIRLQDEVFYNSRQFCSSRYADAAKHPKLVVVYQ